MCVMGMSCVCDGYASVCMEGGMSFACDVCVCVHGGMNCACDVYVCTCVCVHMSVCVEGGMSYACGVCMGGGRGV